MMHGERHIGHAHVNFHLLYARCTTVQIHRPTIIPFWLFDMQSHKSWPNWIQMNRNSVRKLCIQLLVQLLCWQQIHGEKLKTIPFAKRNRVFSRFRHKIQHFTMIAFSVTACELIQPRLSGEMFRSTWHRSPHSSAIHEIRIAFRTDSLWLLYSYGRLPLLRASLCGVVCRSNKNSPAQI